MSTKKRQQNHWSLIYNLWKNKILFALLVISKGKVTTYALEPTHFSGHLLVRLVAEKSVFSPPAGAKVVMASSSARVEKMFASFDLGSVSISFVGMMGDFAVWVKVSNMTMSHSLWLIPIIGINSSHFWNQWKAITDMSTGELIYLIDDNGGSEIFIEFIFTVLMTSQDVFITWWWRHWIVNVIREMIENDKRPTNPKR